MAADSSRFSVGPLQAPRGHGEIFAQPELPEWIELAASNGQALDHEEVQVGSRSLAEFREWSRSVLLAAADRYTAELDSEPTNSSGVPTARDTSRPVFVAGHQPIFAHPGVWAKNFAIAEAARLAQGIALNLIVDNDTVERTSLDVPAGHPDGPWFAPVPFDAPPLRQPWEELTLADENLFRSFADRLADALAPWTIKPLIAAVWPKVVERSRDVRSTAFLLTLMRASLQKRWGMANLELPISRLCETEPFLWFVAGLCGRAEQFRNIHNAALVEYRAQNGIRNDRHPVPPLEAHNGWTELPLWVWRGGDRRRQHLFGKVGAGTVELSNGEQSLGRISLPTDGNYQGAVAQFQQIQQSWKLRPRALTTTIFSRMSFSDLFIHGIGGAKYDEVTDRILDRFYGIKPPTYGVLTATLHLPLPSFNVNSNTKAELVRKLRDMEFNPHHYLADEATAELTCRREAVLAEKESLRRLSRSRHEWRELRSERRRLHHELKTIRETLAEKTVEMRQSVHNDLETVQRELSAERVFRSREYAAVLFPEPEIRNLVETIRNRFAVSARTLVSETCTPQ